MNILTKLFSPKAPAPINFDEGHRVNFAFGKTEAQLVAEQSRGDVPLDTAIKRVAAEIAIQRANVEAGKGARPAVELQEAIERARLATQAATTEHQTYQAKARAGLIKEAAIVPYLRATDEARAVFSRLAAELSVRQEADAAATALAALLEKVR